MSNSFRILIFVLALALGSLFLSSANKVTAQAKPVRFSLAPATGSYKSGASFQSSVNIDTGGMQVSAANIVVAFDKTKLQVTGFEYGGVVPLVEKGLLLDLWVINNTDGYVTAPVLWLDANGYQGSGTMAKITFKVISTGAGTTVRLVDSGGETNQAYQVGGDDQTNVLGATSDATYTLNGQAATTPTKPKPKPKATTTNSNLPNTGISDNPLLFLGGFMLILSGFFYIWMGRKKKTS